ncbi:MAG: hypothetical protein ABH834_08045 [Candidatus Altiarchaeota archaeon]
MVKEYRRIVTASKHARIDREKLEVEGRREREARESLVASVVQPNQVYVPVLGPDGKPIANPRITGWIQSESERGWSMTDVGEAWHGRYAVARGEVLDEVLKDAEAGGLVLSSTQKERMHALCGKIYEASLEEAVIESFTNLDEASESFGKLKPIAVGVHEETQTKYGGASFKTDAYQHGSLDVARMFDHLLHTLKKKNQGE